MPDAPPTHKPRHGKAPRHNTVRNRQQHRHLNTGSKAWRDLRARVLLEEGYLCRVCRKFGDNLDHIDGKASAWEDYRRENLQCLCHACHSAKTRREINARLEGGTLHPSLERGRRDRS
jgi:5-methylcytosine-specific restriction protein A